MKQTSTFPPSFRAGNPTMIPPSIIVDFPNSTRGKNTWQEKSLMQNQILQ